MHSSFSFGIRLWWRRQLFRLRYLPRIWFVVFFSCILLLFILIPNPFSDIYTKIPVNQDVEWNSVIELLQIKEQVLQNDTGSNQIKIVARGSEKETHFQNNILILLYTPIFGSGKYCNLPVDRIFGSSCPSKNRCQWSCDNRRVGEADALIFHAYDILYFQASVPSRSLTKPNAVWILWSDEPPSMVEYVRLQPYRFNWTISYKLNSEVSIATYGVVSQRTSPMSNSEFSLWVQEQFRYRSKGAIWFVSNCQAKERLKLYYALRRASDLVIEGYGRCVDFYPLHLCSSGSQCERNYMGRFKFHLSFESNTCQDYITEKFYKSLFHGLIPIVYGPERKDYERLIPTNSFIHVDEFDGDMTKLAAHLQNISTNVTLFSMYHQWRTKYNVIIDGKALERIRMCELCQRLSQMRAGETMYYEKIDVFYNENCVAS